MLINDNEYYIIDAITGKVIDECVGWLIKTQAVQISLAYCQSLFVQLVFLYSIIIVLA